jgi:uncharacterized protein (UPF0212 family)
MTCPACGTELKTMGDVTNVHLVGLVLKAHCCKCGTRLTVNKIWRRHGGYQKILHKGGKK